MRQNTGNWKAWQDWTQNTLVSALLLSGTTARQPPALTNTLRQLPAFSLCLFISSARPDAWSKQEIKSCTRLDVPSCCWCSCICRVSGGQMWASLQYALWGGRARVWDHSLDVCWLKPLSYFLPLGACSDAACVLVFSNENLCLAAAYQVIWYMHSPHYCLIGHAGDDLSRRCHWYSFNEDGFG